MSERAFSSGGAPAPAHDLLRAAILHHLLTRRPDGAAAGELSRAVLAAVAPPDRDALCAGALVSLERDGLVGRAGRAWAPTRAARAFHRLMLGGRP